MKRIMASVALISLFANGSGVAQTGASSPSGPSSQPNQQSAPDPARNGQLSRPRAEDDSALGAGTSTGTAHPNTTGSSGSSGTSGVDSSTGNSH
jgi:hypothetical protein